MRYEITRRVLGCNTRVPIERADFESIRDASHSLLTLLEIEGDYDILLGNYIDLEKTVLSLAVDSFTNTRQERAQFDRDHRLVNRMIANLLASARAFIDHVKHYVSSIPGSTTAEVDTIYRLFNTEYERSLSYRVIEALRNYTQHCGLPTQSIRYGLRWTGPDETKDEKLVCNVSPSLLVRYLRSDPQFKKTVLEELESSIGDDVPLLPLVREYVSGLSSINAEVRQAYALRKNAWCQTLDKWVERFLSVGPGVGAVGVAAVALDEQGNIREEIHLGIELKERLGSLEDANRRLTNLHKLQVVS